MQTAAGLAVVITEHAGPAVTVIMCADPASPAVAAVAVTDAAAPMVVTVVTVAVTGVTDAMRSACHGPDSRSRST
jgi:hypothetical protein